MTMRAMNAMALLGMLQPAASKIAPGMASALPTSMQDLPHFAETMAKAGMPSAAPSSPHIDTTPTLGMVIPAEAPKLPLPQGNIITVIGAANEESVPSVTQSQVASLPSEPAAQPVEQAASVDPKLQTVSLAPPPVKPLAEVPTPVAESIAPGALQSPRMPDQSMLIAPIKEPVTKPMVTETKSTKHTKETNHSEDPMPEPQSAPATPLSLVPQAVASAVPVQPVMQSVSNPASSETKIVSPGMHPASASTKAKAAPPAASVAQPISALPEKASAGAEPTHEPAAEAFVLASIEQPQLPVPTIAPLPVASVRALRKAVVEAAKPVSQKTLAEAQASVPTNHATPLSVPQTAEPHPSPSSIPSTENAPTILPAISQQVIVDVVPTHQQAHLKDSTLSVSDVIPTPAASLSPTQHTLPHTTLQASPTVLEIGVPSGSHGWLKIRAEIDDTGMVQASLSPATHAAHETLHRDLSAMTSFLSNEQLSVQLHVAEPPQAVSSGEHDFMQNAATPNQSGSNPNNRHNAEPTTFAASLSDSPETEWSAAASGPSILYGGSWVNVVA